MEAALRAAGEPEKRCLFRPRGIAVIVLLFFRTIRFMAPSSEAAYWKCLCRDGDVNVKNVAVSVAVKIGRSWLWISMKVRLSLYQTTLFWFFPQPAVKSLDASWQYSCVDQLCSQTGLREQRSNFCFISLFFFSSWIRSQNTSPVEREKKKTTTTKLSKWRPTKRSDTLILTVDFYSRMIWRRTRRAPAPVYD